MLSFDLIVVFVVITFILISLYWELLGAALTFILAIIVFGIFGILTPGEILHGFANQHIAVIIMLLIIGELIRRTGVIEYILDRVFSNTKTYKGFLGRMMVLISSFSAFLNNTPLVAIMMPYIKNWCNKHDNSPSKYLIPLSYAAILGGCMTLIGTSTNLVVSGLVVDTKIFPDLQPLNIFDFTAVGLPMIIIGIIYLLFFSNRLLPARKDVVSEFSINSRQYLVEAEIRPNSKLVGISIEEGGLRHLKGLYLVEIIRDDYKITPVSPEVILQKGDILIFAGDTHSVADMVKLNTGLTFPTVGLLHRKKKTGVHEIIISPNSSLINRTVREYNFRAKYDAAVIAVHRNGEKISGKIGNIELKAGDVLLVFTGGDFFQRINNTRDFYLISQIRNFEKIETYKIVTLVGGTFAAIILSAFHLISLFMGLIIVILTSIAMNLIAPKEIPKLIDYELGVIIALALALGTAMTKTGAADLVANLLISIFVPLGPIGLLFGIYLITTILAAYITNKASVAIIFPISLTMAKNLNLDPMPFILVVAFASAANFITPIGYQTNLMVYGPGRYSFKDFFRIGFPLTVIYMIVTVSILSLMYFKT